MVNNCGHWTYEPYTPTDKKCYAYVGQVSGSDNLINYCERRKDEGVNCIMICETKKQAERIVEEWNETYKSDGTYLLTS